MVLFDSDSRSHQYDVARAACCALAHRLRRGASLQSLRKSREYLTVRLESSHHWVQWPHVDN
jgi:hypothetical protein